MFEIRENGQSILRKFILISTKCCHLQGTLSLSELPAKSFAGANENV